ncbi:MAG: alpha/beta hydrolase [Rhodoferax sp.]|nr:alpha/beta hydrolase [Rhodoferax sp.]MBP7493822.1 alpha/beta hydrolase [Rhodoferax sp.]
MYQAQRLSRSDYVPLRNLNYHVRVWGTPAPDKTPLVLLHGWMDVAASYQFVVDALHHDHYIIAPDWRGFGLTTTVEADNFWFPDYLADLDFLLDHYVPDGPIHLVGHSMGGNVAMLYAGIRPERIRRLVNLEGFGMPATRPSQAAGRYASWMDSLKKLHQGEMDLKAYDSVDGVAQRLMKTNARLSADKAHWLARHWAQETVQGQWRILGQAAHKMPHAMLYRLDEVQALYGAITAPTLMVEAADDSLGLWFKGKFTLEEHHERVKVVAQLKTVQVADAGHMVHHDQPQLVANLIDEFLLTP